MYELCDIHAHFLPNMDDGCDSVEESVQVLQESAKQGILGIFATPHYYPVESVETFLQRRGDCYEKLQQAVANTAPQIPQIRLGAEVAYHPGLGQEENLHSLCLGNSRYLLLEMPFSHWGSDVIRTVRNISVSGIVPVIAHVERYLKLQNNAVIEQLLEQEVLVQMNADSLLRFGSASIGRRLLQNGVVHLLGSDCHNMTTRCPNLGSAIAALEKRGMSDVIGQLSQCSMQIFAEAANE